jgi:hypothetical protein
MGAILLTVRHNAVLEVVPVAVERVTLTFPVKGEQPLPLRGRVVNFDHETPTSSVNRPVGGNDPAFLLYEVIDRAIPFDRIPHAKLFYHFSLSLRIANRVAFRAIPLVKMTVVRLPSRLQGAGRHDVRPAEGRPPVVGEVIVPGTSDPLNESAFFRFVIHTFTPSGFATGVILIARIPASLKVSVMRTQPSFK